MDIVDTEYMRRNLLCAKAIGAQAAIRKALEETEKLKRPPKRLIKRLRHALERLEDVPADLAQHRNSVYAMTPFTEPRRPVLIVDSDRNS